MAHVGNESGLQAHSVGDYYPWRVVGKGSHRSQWYNGETGELAGPWIANELLKPCPPCQTVGDWVVRFQLSGVSWYYRACAYNVRTQQHGPWYNADSYERAFNAAVADIPPIVEPVAEPVADNDGPALVEFTVLIPVNRDSDKRAHDYLTVRNFEIALAAFAGGFTKGNQRQGIWNGIRDTSEVYIVALEAYRVPDFINGIIAEACREFDQQCLYVSQTGRARLITPSGVRF